MEIRIKKLILCIGLLLLANPAAAEEESAFAVEPRITMLSTMLANFPGDGEWGFSALIETQRWCGVV